MWKDIPTFEGEYQVSSDGEIRRHPEHIPSKASHIKPGELLRHRSDGKGYRICRLYRKSPYAEISVNVHVLVAAAFLGPPPVDHAVNHKNGIKSDNRVANLEYVTYQENIRHAKRTGLWNHYGSQHCAAKLSDDQVRSIRLLATEHTQAEIARRFGVSKSTIGMVIRRKTWAHI